MSRQVAEMVDCRISDHEGLGSFLSLGISGIKCFYFYSCGLL